MRKWYEVDFKPDLAVSKLGDRDESERYEKGKNSFNPMYLIKNNPGDPAKLEMCFDCSNFQFQLKEQDKPFEDHAFQVRLSRAASQPWDYSRPDIPTPTAQTIFLNKKHEHLWSKDEIRKDKISASPSHRLSDSLRGDLTEFRPLLASSRGLVASALPRLEALRGMRPVDVAPAGEEMRALRRRLDPRQRPVSCRSFFSLRVPDSTDE